MKREPMTDARLKEIRDATLLGEPDEVGSYFVVLLEDALTEIDRLREREQDLRHELNEHLMFFRKQVHQSGIWRALEDRVVSVLRETADGE